MAAVLDLQGLAQASNMIFPCLSVISIRSLPTEEDL
jgi:hypothetical protein